MKNGLKCEIDDWKGANVKNGWKCEMDDGISGAGAIYGIEMWNVKCEKGANVKMV